MVHVSGDRNYDVTVLLTSMLNALPRRHKLIFRNPDIDPLTSMEAFRRVFAARRSRITQKLQNAKSGTSVNENEVPSMTKEDHVCKVAKTVEEAMQLVEGGFDYLTEIDGMKLFRKRK